MSDYSLTIYDKSGLPLDEIRATFHCIWTLNKPGRANFEMSINDAKCTEENLRFGNFVLFRHARLGDWAGVIIPQDRRVWNASRKTVRVQMLSAEFQLGRRRGPSNYLFKGGSAGALFKALIAHGNGQGDMLVQEGTIWQGGGPHEETSRNDNLLEAWTRVQKRGGFDWWISPTLTNGRLSFLANLADRRGESTGYVLQEGVNLETPSDECMSEGGRQLVNDLVVVGEGATADVRPEARARDQSSIDSYGLWQGDDSSEASSPATLQAQASERVSLQAEPTKRFKLTAIECAQSLDTFAYIGMGNIVGLELYSVGFYAGQNGVSTSVRILSREYSTEYDKAILVQEEI